jgi:hypothetical protein
MTHSIETAADVPLDPVVSNANDPAQTRREQNRERLLKAQQKMNAMRAAGWKPVLLNPVEKALANPKSTKLAIVAHCWTCSGANADPGVKFRVRDCSVKSCALWPHRPWQSIKGGFVEGEEGRLVPTAESEGTDESDDVADTTDVEDAA